jgi:hypothetical protein
MSKVVKTMLAIASTAALIASAPAHALSVPCPASLGLEQCYTGAVFSFDTAFSGVSAGTLTLGAGNWDVSGFFGSSGIDNLSFKLDDMTPVGDTFSNLAAGSYMVKLSGNLTEPFTNTSYLGVYGGGFDIKAAVPEPQTYALMLAGLLAVGYVARRRKTD